MPEPTGPSPGPSSGQMPDQGAENARDPCAERPGEPLQTLNDIRPGGRVRIRRHRSSGAVRQRLLDLGLMPNVIATVVRSAPLNDPIELKLDASNVSLRRKEARTIEVIREAADHA